MDINRNQAGIALGLLFGVWHALWEVAVAVGSADLLLDWLHGAHFISNPYTLSKISLGTALLGIIGAFVSGYVLGWVFALFWNWSGRFLSK